MFNEAIRNLANSGSVGILPTDTVYGVVAKASDKQAVARLYALKQRKSKPGSIIASSIDQLAELGIKSRYLKAVEQFWPGAVSVIIPVSDPSLDYLHQGKMSLAVRIPKPKELRDLLNKTGPLLTTSANPPGEDTAINIEQAKNYFNTQVDFYIDGGDLSNHKPSTIIRVLDDAIEVIRQGEVKVKSE